jgi:hypothetical protein
MSLLESSLLVSWPDAPTLVLLRKRIGLDPADTSRDDEITAVFAASIEALESALDRRLPLGVYTEQFTHAPGPTLSLSAYPVRLEQPVLVTVDGIDVPGHVDPATGLLYLDAYSREHTLLVVYTGGFDPLPPTLLMAVFSVFDIIAAQSAKVVQPGGEVKALSLDGARVEYFDPLRGDAAGGLVPASVLATLNSYVRKSA